MFPYISKTFEYPNNVNAVDRLRETMAPKKWSRIKPRLDGKSVSLEHSTVYFHNSWNPIFQGRIESIGNRQRLVGYFRLNWFVLAFAIFFVSSSLFHLLQTYFSPDVIPGYVQNWKPRRLLFDLQFFGMAVAINIIGWVAGIPNQNRILAAIRESMNSSP